MKSQNVLVRNGRVWPTAFMALVVIVMANISSLGYAPPNGTCEKIANELKSLEAQHQQAAKNLQETKSNYYTGEVKDLLKQIAQKKKQLKDCLLFDGENALTKRVGKLLVNATDGDVGLYLKKVNGPVLASLHETMDFEPASTIKILLHLHAMRQVENGAKVQGKVVSLATPIPWFMNYTKDGKGKNTSCPSDTGLATETLANALQQMMQNSDNRRAQAVRTYFGQTNINATAKALGMTHTSYNHRDGCGGGADGAVADPNHLTLVDAGILYEGVAKGTFINDRKAFFSLMAGKNYDFSTIWQGMQKIVNEEAPAGMTAAKRQSFLDQMDTRYKGGGYSLSTGEHQSIAGWAKIPFRNARVIGGVAFHEYVFGFFISKASDLLKTNNASTAVRAELFREEIRESLKSW